MVGISGKTGQPDGLYSARLMRDSCMLADNDLGFRIDVGGVSRGGRTLARWGTRPIDLVPTRDHTRALSHSREHACIRHT